MPYVNPDNLFPILKSAACQGFKSPTSPSSVVDICKFESEHFLAQINTQNKDIIRSHYKAVFCTNCCIMFTASLLILPNEGCFLMIHFYYHYHCHKDHLIHLHCTCCCRVWAMVLKAGPDCQTARCDPSQGGCSSSAVLPQSPLQSSNHTKMQSSVSFLCPPLNYEVLKQQELSRCYLYPAYYNHSINVG